MGNRKKATEKLAKQMISVRQRRIRKIKSKISSGTYRVPNGLLARALLFSL